MILADFLPAKRGRVWDPAKQVGVTHVICECAPEVAGPPAPDDLEALRTIRGRFPAAGLTLHGLEGDEFTIQRIRLGLPGRDEDMLGRQTLPLAAVDPEPVAPEVRITEDMTGILDAHRIPYR